MAEQFPTLEAMKLARRWLLSDPEKVPYYVNGQRRHGTLDGPDDVAQLASYHEASAVLAARPGWLFGFALGPDGAGGNWQGIDLDKVVANQLADLANYVPGYVEMSPSGTGAHAVGYGRHFSALGPNATGIEAYAGGRYFTVTEQPIRDSGLMCLADGVEQVLAPQHSAARAASSGAGAVTVGPKAVTELRSALFHMRADEYDIWYRMGLALKELGDTGRGLWMDWSATSGKFDPTKSAKKWEGFAPRGTGYQAVFAEAARQGWINPASNAAQLPPSPPISNQRRLRLLLDSDLERLPLPRWLVKGIVPDKGIGAIFGDSGTFKSFLTLDLLAHISNGREWFGHRVRPAPAVYVPFEGQGGVPSRIKAWRLAQSAQRNPNMLFSVVPLDDVRSHIAVIMEPLNLREHADRDTLVATLTEQGWAGGVLCIDTLAHASAGLDENSSAMGEMLTIFRDLQYRLGGVILLIHHSGKDASRGMRGWSGVHAAMDFVIECLRDKDSASHEAEFVITKAKDGETGVRTKFLMHTVQIGIDEDGDYVSSLVVSAPQGEDPSGDPDNPFKIKADEVAMANDDDAFVDSWLRETVLSGGHPTGRWLEAQRPHIKGRRNLTQKRLRDAIERLKAEGRLKVTSYAGPSGTKWLRPVDLNGPPVEQ